MRLTPGGRDITAGSNRPTQDRVRVRIPKDNQQEPVISRLVSDYGLVVNIVAAILSPNAREDGWFDLNLKGTAPQIQSAMTYMKDLDLEIWREPADPTAETW